MREIQKGSEPRSLTQYRSAGGEYDGPNFTPIKNSIRLSLLKEQGYLCAYCMTRIAIDDMKVEHWACQDQNPMLQLDYSNLLGCCKGGEGEKFVNQTCDSRKGNSHLKYTPCRSLDRINTLIKYDSQGKILSTDGEFSEQLNKVLNLNKARLVQNRDYVLRSLRTELASKSGARTKSEIRRLLDKKITPNNHGHFREYLGLIQYYLISKL